MLSFLFLNKITMKMFMVAAKNITFVFRKTDSINVLLFKPNESN